MEPRTLHRLLARTGVLQNGQKGASPPILEFLRQQRLIENTWAIDALLRCAQKNRLFSESADDNDTPLR